MSKTMMKVFGIICLVLCVVNILMAIHYYQANAARVAETIGAGQSKLPAGVKLTPAVPPETTNSVFLAILFGAVGYVMLWNIGKIMEKDNGNFRSSEER